MAKQAIAIYDLDLTVTRVATFTPFLLYAVVRAPWRALLAPLALPVFVAYGLKLIGRSTLKCALLHLFLGRPRRARLEALAEGFAAQVDDRYIRAEARARIAADRAAGCRLAVATASSGFTCVRWRSVWASTMSSQRKSLCRRRTATTLAGAGKLLCRSQAAPDRGVLPAARGACGAGYPLYSDHASDAPSFEAADQAVVVSPKAGFAQDALQRGWPVETWR
ncbi:hypothetical protein E6W36_00175 [Hankyongella ginsenosidimutans]|uniref:Haloacid dehalogenase-like hydrolase n=1 Tax=Hankyongella ginsenosidimutans TaxID=1763828 RepID=A0A4D7C7U1_9SPHN|nr:haloacid dehalogenase-like hydrolase [Hankyongella ginsenosidimutans]QCI78617.1 hypothetical protein E6W36_00175 [Hankyongella ginsenosidimutans]